jgi:hypothetical protein
MKRFRNSRDVDRHVAREKIRQTCAQICNQTGMKLPTALDAQENTK